MSQDRNNTLPRRLQSECKTIFTMISLYCRAHHKSGNTLCADCEQLKMYAEKRIHHCPFQSDKPTCGNCMVHCYKSDMQEKVRKIMRFAGPRMIYKHPFMAIQHLYDSHRKAPELLKSNTKYTQSKIDSSCTSSKGKKT